MSKYPFVKAHAGTWAVSDLCRVLEVSRSDYYQWQAAAPPVPCWAAGCQVGRYALRSWLRASGQRALST